MTRSKNPVPTGEYELPDLPGNSLELPVMFPKMMDLDTPDFVKAHRTEQLAAVNTLIAGFNTRREQRLGRLRRLVPGDTMDSTVLLMTLNLGHLSLFRNWVRSCELCEVDCRSWSFVLALDEPTEQVVRDLGFVSYLDPESYGEHSEAPVAQYGDAQFARVMFPKTAVVQDFLDLGYDVLFQDVDMVWRRDPREFILHEVRRHLDVQFMYDGPNRIYQPLHANTGFFLIRNTPRGRSFWQKVFNEYDKILWYRSQQIVANIVLVNYFFRGLRLSILPESEFANGHLFSISSADGLPADPAVIHCSWTANLDHKLEKLKLAGLWYL